MIKLALKDLKLFVKDKRNMLLTFVLPIALITLFAFAFGGAGKSKKEKKASMQISDLDKSPASRSAIQIFDTLENIQVKLVELSEAQGNIKKGSEACVLIIHKGFSDSLSVGSKLPLELQYDEANEIQVGLLQESLVPTIASLPFNIGDPKVVMKRKFSGIIKNSDQATKANVDQISDDLFDQLSKGIVQGDSQNTNPAAGFFEGSASMTKLMAAKKDNSLGLVQAVAGTAVMMLLFSVVGIGVSILEEKQEGTLKRLLYTPTNPINILFGKMLSANVISILQLAIMFLFAGLAFGLEILPHLGGLVITIFTTAFACSAFGVFLASFAKSRQQVQGLSTLIILVMSAIGGSMIPLFIMPEFMQKAAVFSVNYWSIQSFYDLFWRDLPITDWTYISRVLVLALIGIILNSLAIVLFKRNILKLN